MKCRQVRSRELSTIVPRKQTPIWLRIVVAYTFAVIGALWGLHIYRVHHKPETFYIRMDDGVSLQHPSVIRRTI